MSLWSRLRPRRRTPDRPVPDETPASRTQETARQARQAVSPERHDPLRLHFLDPA